MLPLPLLEGRTWISAGRQGKSDTLVSGGIWTEALSSRIWPCRSLSCLPSQQGAHGSNLRIHAAIWVDAVKRVGRRRGSCESRRSCRIRAVFRSGCARACWGGCPTSAKTACCRPMPYAKQLEQRYGFAHRPSRLRPDTVLSNPTMRDTTLRFAVCTSCLGTRTVCFFRQREMRPTERTWPAAISRARSINFLSTGDKPDSCSLSLRT